MSEDVKEEKAQEIVISNDAITDTETGETMSIKDMAAALKKQEEGMEVTSVYFEFPMGEAVRCYYVGDTTIKGQNNQEVPAVRILLEDETLAITASAVIVSTFKNYAKMKAFSVKRTGEHQGPNGKYYTYKIFELVG